MANYIDKNIEERNPFSEYDVDYSYSRRTFGLWSKLINEKFVNETSEKDFLKLSESKSTEYFGSDKITLESEDFMNLPFIKKSVIEDIKSEGNLVAQRGVILKEAWLNEFNIPSRIVAVSKDIVQCECVIDADEKVFETRAFPKVVFEHLPNLEKNRTVMVSIKSKKGSIRIDVVDGKGLVDEKLFYMDDPWTNVKEKLKPKQFRGKNA